MRYELFRQLYMMCKSYINCKTGKIYTCVWIYYSFTMSWIWDIVPKFWIFQKVSWFCPEIRDIFLIGPLFRNIGPFSGILGHISCILKIFRAFVFFDSLGIDLDVMHSWMPGFFADFFQNLEMALKICPDFLQNLYRF